MTPLVHPSSRSAIILARGREGDAIPKRSSDPERQSVLLEYVLDAVWTVVDEMNILFTHEPALELVEVIAPFGVKMIIREGKGGDVDALVTGFKMSHSDHCIVVPENAPFLKPNVIYALFEAAREVDAAIPRWPDGRTEPLLAVYRRKAFVRAASQYGNISDAQELANNLYAVRYVDIEKELRPLDPELHSFFKVESEKSLEQARVIVSKN